MKHMQLSKFYSRSKLLTTAIKHKFVRGVLLFRLKFGKIKFIAGSYLLHNNAVVILKTTQKKKLPEKQFSVFQYLKRYLGII